MTNGLARSKFVVAIVATLVLIPEAAYAYGGPGSIVSGLGALVAVIVAIAAAVAGFFWYPIKRLVQRLRGRTEGEDEEPEVAEAS